MYLMFFLFIFTGCFKDLGNYDYKDIDRVEITFNYYGHSSSMGSTLNIEPILVPNINETSEHHTFKWILEGETRDDWNKRTFSWVVDKVIPYGRLVLEVTDTRTGMMYSNRVSVVITGIYETSDSWMILSDDNGSSLLSFLSVSGLKYKDGSDQLYFSESQLIRDVHAGTSLGKGPIAIQEHYRGNDRDNGEMYVDDPGNVAIFQKSGAVDLNGETFDKEINFIESFDGGVLNEGATELHPGAFMSSVDIMTDQEGRLYSRIRLPITFHNNYFLNSPLKVEGETNILKNCTICRGYYSSDKYGYSLIYDGQNKRLLSISDSGVGDHSNPLDGAGKVEPIIVSDEINQNDIIPLDNMQGYDLLNISMAQGESPSWGAKIYSYYLLLAGTESTQSDKVYIQKLIDEEVSSSRSIEKIEKVEILGLPGIPTSSAFTVYNPQEYAFLSVGKKLYLVDILNNYETSLYYEFESNITKLCISKSWTVKDAHLAVGLEDGEFSVLAFYQAKLIREEDKLVYTATEKVGRIVDIKTKCNAYPNY